jgi:3-methylcrotonyl-CoA carboxylase alpha subunit
MSAKLIVQGPTREAAIQKLRAALEEYEVAGPITNIEFIKKMCVSPDFVAGDVETGYIEKHRAELFTPEPPAPEVYAQAALGLALQEIRSAPSSALLVTTAGFGTGFQQREFNLVEIPADGKGDSTSTSVKILQTSPSKFNVTVGDKEYRDVTSTLNSSNTLSTFYPHTRLETTFIRDEDRLTLFQRGKQYRLQLAMPKWAEKALGIKDVTNSVLAPMPCKVLRVEVAEGDTVTKDQPLVVIESMKMETVIRSPHDGVIARVVHGKGVSLSFLTGSLSNHRVLIFPRTFVRLVRRLLSLLRRESSLAIASLKINTFPNNVSLVRDSVMLDALSIT